jgi:hypothetical protein
MSECWECWAALFLSLLAVMLSALGLWVRIRW